MLRIARSKPYHALCCKCELMTEPTITHKTLADYTEDSRNANFFVQMWYNTGVSRVAPEKQFHRRLTHPSGELAKVNAMKTCQLCGAQFKPYSHTPDQKFCSRKCYNETRPKKVKLICAYCGKPFEEYEKQNQICCSTSCGISMRNLTDANPAFHRDISGEKNPMYGRGHLLAGENNGMYGNRKELAPSWNGGKRKRPDGYVRAVAPDDHPYPSDTKNGTKYVLEHRLVMETHLGRFLSPDEVVHHIDENPSNNAIENLELFASQSEHVRVRHGRG